MDRLRIGRSVRPIRIRLNLTQAETAHRAGVSRPYVSRIERGLIGSTDFDSVERVCRALGADLDVRVRWRGEGLDLLLDEAHATLVDLVVRLLGPLGWTTALEVTFNAYGERGSIDVLAWQPTTRALLVVEVKSVFADAQGTLLPLDRKARLGRAIAADRTWEAASVSRLLVLWDSSMNRKRCERIRATLDQALPLHGWEMRRWLQHPAGSVAGRLFLSDDHRGSATRRATGRVRVRKARVHHPGR